MFKRLLFILLVATVAIPLHANIDISDHQPIDYYNGAPLYDLSEITATISMHRQEGEGYQYNFDTITIDGVDIDYATINYPFFSRRMNFAKYFDGSIHELKIGAGHKCYFTSSTIKYLSLDGVKYLISDETNEALVVGCEGEEANICIKPELSKNGNTYITTTIFHQAFQNCKNMQSIDIPESVTAIQAEAFRLCSSLANINLPKTITTVGEEAFSGCSTLNSIKLPNSLTQIDKYAFYDCRSLQSIEIPKSVTSIELGAFYNCVNLSELILRPTSKINIPNIFSQKLLTHYGLVDTAGHNLTNITMVENFGPWMNELFSTTTVYTLPDKYDQANEARGNQTWKIQLLPDIKVVDINSKLDRITFKIENNIKAEINSVKFNEIELNASEAGEYSIEGLTPASNYSCQIDYSNPEWGDLSKTVSFNTQALNLTLDISQITQSSASIKVSFTADPRISTPVLILNNNEYPFKNDAILKLTGLTSNTQYTAKAKVIFNNVTYSSADRFFKTGGVKPNINVSEMTPTSIIINANMTDKGDAVISSENFMVNNTNYQNKTQRFVNQPLRSTYTARYSVNNEQAEASFELPELELTTIAARAASKDCAIICAETNMSEEEYGGGFEWRRYDAPDMVPSTFSPCPVANGHMEGRLRGLSTNTYYKYRPYYEDCNGNRTFGEWTAFITADADVYFEPTVYTYAPNSVTKNSATVVGYAIGGSEDVDEQGFEYWPTVGSRATTDVRRVLATGQRMTATLEDLEPGTRYTVRAFATTKTKTTYGDNQEFETDGEPESAIEPIAVDETEVQPFDIYTLSGVCVRRHTTDLSGLRPGLYIANGKKILVH